MADQWEHNVEVHWNEDQSQVTGFTVNGEKMSLDEYRIKHMLAAAKELKQKVLEMDSLTHPIDLNVKLKRIEEAYVDMKSVRSRFFTLLEIIRTRTELIHKNHC